MSLGNVDVYQDMARLSLTISSLNILIVNGEVIGRYSAVLNWHKYMNNVFENRKRLIDSGYTNNNIIARGMRIHT